MYFIFDIVTFDISSNCRHFNGSPLLCPINATSSFSYVFTLHYPRVLHCRIVPIQNLKKLFVLGRKKPPIITVAHICNTQQYLCMHVNILQYTTIFSQCTKTFLSTQQYFLSAQQYFSVHSNIFSVHNNIFSVHNNVFSQRTTIFSQCTTIFSQCTTIFSQCTTIFSQCTDIFFDAPIFFSMHRYFFRGADIFVDIFYSCIQLIWPWTKY